MSISMIQKPKIRRVLSKVKCHRCGREITKNHERRHEDACSKGKT